MADDPQKRLERQARHTVPPVDPAFADRLESKLRADHATHAPRRGWSLRSAVPRVLAAAALVVAGIAGVMALDDEDAGRPVAVVDSDPASPLDAPVDESGPMPPPASVPTEPAEPDALDRAPAIPTAPPTATEVPTVEPAEVLIAPDAATPTPVSSTPVPSTPVTAAVSTPSPLPSPTAIPAPPAELSPTPVPATPTTTPTPVPTTTPVPRPTPTTQPTSTPTPSPTPSPTLTPLPTPTPEPALIDLVCDVRTSGDATGVVCTWNEPTIDPIVAGYDVLRSRNSGDAQVVAQQRATAARSFVDRDVESGDEVVYLVQALDADRNVVGASVRQIVQVD